MRGYQNGYPSTRLSGSGDQLSYMPVLQTLPIDIDVVGLSRRQTQLSYRISRTFFANLLHTAARPAKSGAESAVDISNRINMK